MCAGETVGGELVERCEQVLVACECGGVFGADGGEGAEFEDFTGEEKSGCGCCGEGSEGFEFEEGEFGG